MKSKMAFSLKKPVMFLITFLSLTHLSFSVTDIHDLLTQYNLPKGLLPSNIKSYTMSPDNSITIELSSHPCYINYYDQVVYYDRIIKGKLEYGKIYGVSGIQAKQFFLWLPVTGIDVAKNGMLNFYVGPLSKEMPAKDFENIRTCKAKGLRESFFSVLDDSM